MMRGNQSVIEARINNANVEQIWVHVLDTDPPAEHREFNDPENMLHLGMLPEILIYRNDNVGKLDLRCVMGLIVHLSGNNERRTMQALNRINEFKPMMVFAMLGEKLLQTAFKVAA